MNQIEFAFPLPRVHTGVHLANGRMGVLVWGTTCLCLTVAHAGFWDRRGARPFATPMNYRDMKGMLLGGLEQHVRDAFQEPNGSPYQIGGGRIELHFGEVTPCSATLNTLSGILSICMSNGEEVLVFQSMTTNVLGVEVPDSLKSALDVRVRPSWEWTSEVLAVKGVDPPTLFATGFCQSTPDDASLTVGYIPTSKGMSIFAELGCTPFEELCNNLRLVNQYQL